jgi:hypothetical protein
MEGEAVYLEGTFLEHASKRNKLMCLVV